MLFERENRRIGLEKVKKELFFRTDILSTLPEHTRSMGSSAERWLSNRLFQQQSNNRDRLSGCFPSGNL